MYLFLIRIYLKNEFWQELRKSESLCTLTVRHKSRHGHAHCYDHAHGHGKTHDQDHAHGTVRPKVIILLHLILKFSNFTCEKKSTKKKMKIHSMKQWIKVKENFAKNKSHPRKDYSSLCCWTMSHSLSLSLSFKCSRNHNRILLNILEK